MIEPALSLGVQIRLYPLNADLSPDLATLKLMLSGPGSQRRAVLLTHYFGFQQDVVTVKAVCDAAGATLIEDASHAFVTDPALGPPLDLGDEIGRVAEIGVASPYKFLPAPDGGLLWTAADRAPAPLPRPAPLSDELRAWMRFARALLTKPSSSLPDPVPDPAAPAAPAREWVEPLQLPSPSYQPDLEGQRSLGLTRWLMARADADAIRVARRRHYRRWSEVVAGLPSASALRTELDERTVPYMFPLLLDNAEPLFSRLKAAGLPIWRWDEQVESTCRVSRSYRLRLLHLPCHEGLDDKNLDWMTALLRRELKRGGV